MLFRDGSGNVWSTAARPGQAARSCSTTRTAPFDTMCVAQGWGVIDVATGVVMVASDVGVIDDVGAVDDVGVVVVGSVLVGGSVVDDGGGGDVAVVDDVAPVVEVVCGGREPRRRSYTKGPKRPPQVAQNSKRSRSPSSENEMFSRDPRVVVTEPSSSHTMSIHPDPGWPSG